MQTNIEKLANFQKIYICFDRHLVGEQQNFKAEKQDSQSKKRSKSAKHIKSEAPSPNLIEFRSKSAKNFKSDDESNPNLIEFNEPPFAGTFIRLEQIWWETHVAYLESKNMENSDAQNIQSKTPRPTSATSLRSSRFSRANKSWKNKDIKFRPVTAASSPTFNPRHKGCFNTQHFVLL